MHIENIEAKAVVGGRVAVAAALAVSGLLTLLGWSAPEYGSWWWPSALRQPLMAPSLGLLALASACSLFWPRVHSYLVTTAIAAALAGAVLVGATRSSSGHLGGLVFAFLAGALASATWTLLPARRWFRVSKPSPAWWRVVRTVGQATLFTGTFLGWFGWLVLGLERSLPIPRLHELDLVIPGLVVGIVLQGAQLGSAVWLALRGEGTPLPIDTAAKLVVAGPYAYVRNPIAMFGIAQGVLAGIVLGSASLTVYSLMGAALWHAFVRPIEEHDLTERFGAPYMRYQRSVRLWIPHLRPYAEPAVGDLSGPSATGRPAP
ncbi:MAG: isoprenylcysteine carboxylmethyltransferase family protein [Myxococcales bacterium]|nr:isoprenylcysteine carboxylmethyltransferase family protein [Myxococcales bacterium]